VCVCVCCVCVCVCVCVRACVRERERERGGLMILLFTEHLFMPTIGGEKNIFQYFFFRIISFVIPTRRACN
jgi:hypothetical protein